LFSGSIVFFNTPLILYEHRKRAALTKPCIELFSEPWILA
jgi:hypothetical protein